jgi:hypothetical protein
VERVSLAWATSPLVFIWALAAARLTRLWTRDSLPPLPAFRQYVATRWGHKAWSELVDCPWCAGFWITLGACAVASTPAEPVLRWVAVPLALSMIVSLLAAHGE